MSRNFNDLLSKLKVGKRKKLSVAVAQDEPVLEAVKAAKERGIADAILVGNKEEIEKIATKIDMDLSDFVSLIETKGYDNEIFGTFVIEDVSGATVTTSLCVPPFLSVTLVLSSVTFSAGTITLFDTVT